MTSLLRVGILRSLCERDDSNAKYMANDEIAGGDESNMNYLMTKKKKTIMDIM